MYRQDVGREIDMIKTKVNSQWMNGRYILACEKPDIWLNALASYIDSDISDDKHAERVIQWHRDILNGVRPDGYQWEGNGYHMFTCEDLVYLECEWADESRVMLTVDHMIDALEKFIIFYRSDIFNEAFTPEPFWVEYICEGSEATRAFGEKVLSSNNEELIDLWVRTCKT
jgi:hypothetical protein